MPPHTCRRRPFAVAVLLACGALHQARGQANRRPLSSADVEDIAKLEMLEDRRQFDSTELARILAAPHPELRRRAAISIARINDKRGTALLRSRALDADTAVAASVVFAVGQLRDTLAVAFLDSLLSDSRTPPTMATEAAAGLGKIRSVPARMALERYLARAAANERTTETIGEALLAVGRVTQRGDIRPIVKWSTSPDEELRWRAAWSLFRPRDPAAVATLITLGSDQSALVRSWAVRGLARPQADSVGLGPKAEALLIAAARDIDRRVRTEALRALGTYSDSLVVNALLAGLRSADSWISVSASEGMARVKAPATITSLVLTATGAPSCTIRLAAMQALFAFSMPDAVQGAIGALHHPSPYCRLTALQALARDTTDIPARAIGRAAVDAFLQDRLLALRSQAWLSHWTILDSELDATARRTARRIDVLSPDHVQRAASLRAMVQWADTTDLPLLLDLYARAVKDTAGGVASSSVAVIAAIQRRQGQGTAAFLARFQAPENMALRRDIERTLGAPVRTAWQLPAITTIPQRPLADYQTIVERWVVSDYNGTPRPQAKWETPRGPIVLELYPGDAPLAVDDFVRTVETGTISGTEFIRVVADFVDQQRAVRNSTVLRDEVNRHRLTRGNLAWATAGLDTGTPGYTLNHTPQPHNEGDFTSLGRVIEGMDAVDRIELGDFIMAAKMLRGGTSH